MKILGIMWLVLFVLMILFADVKINGVKTNNLIRKIAPSFIGSAVLTIILGLPILGILRLLGV